MALYKCYAFTFTDRGHRTRVSTFGDRAFPFAAVRVGNEIPRHVTSAPSPKVFWQRDWVYDNQLRLNLIDWGLMALSAQLGYIVPLISMFQLEKVKLIGES